MFSASIRYGHSVSNKDISQRTYPQPNVVHYTVPGSPPLRAPKTPLRGVLLPPARRATNIISSRIFRRPKMSGLVCSAARTHRRCSDLGVRFAQFSSTSNIALKSDPDFHRLYKYLNYPGVGINNAKLAPLRLTTATRRAFVRRAVFTASGPQSPGRLLAIHRQREETANPVQSGARMRHCCSVAKRQSIISPRFSIIRLIHNMATSTTAA